MCVQTSYCHLCCCIDEMSLTATGLFILPMLLLLPGNTVHRICRSSFYSSAFPSGIHTPMTEGGCIFKRMFGLTWFCVCLLFHRGYFFLLLLCAYIVQLSSMHELLSLIWSYFKRNSVILSFSRYNYLTTM